MSIQQRLNEIASNLSLFDDPIQKYEYIIELGKALKPLDEKFHTDAYKVQGCQSSVWMHLFIKDEKLTIQADSDAFIVKGLVAIIISVYEDATCSEIKAFDKALLDHLGLDEIITPGRQNGVASMIKKVYDFCQAKENL
ncbi:MAG: SufE family protein [Thiovulaceae bacterium]|nr:SufE family protein [Sulfurimonadaceae bacterium]